MSGYPVMTFMHCLAMRPAHDRLKRTDLEFHPPEQDGLDQVYGEQRLSPAESGIDSFRTFLDATAAGVIITMSRLARSSAWANSSGRLRSMRRVTPRTCSAA
jgi:hypothetical protein